MLKYITNLHDFYCSKEWQETKQKTWFERLNKNGELICKDCGLPIIKKKDGVLHHEIELNLQNVNDLSISLNPNNLTWLHHRCHNIRHTRFCSFQRKVYLVVGSPLSGKSTFVKNVATENDLILDFDRLYEAISTSPIHIKNNRIKPVAFALRECLMEQIKMRTGKWLNCYIISTEPYVMNRKRLVDSLGVDEIIYMDETKEECLKRLYENPDNRDIELYKKLIEDFYNNYQPDELI